MPDLSAELPPRDGFNWMFADMNSYFASVEQHDRPELRCRKVAVVPVLSENTCVIAASHDAKRCGVKVGTRVSDARQLCPDIAIIRARPDRYVTLHREIIRSVDRCAPIHKVYSIDEWAIRLLGKETWRDRAMEIGEHIHRQLKADFSPWLTCSIGIAPTRLLAKIACDLRKPNGLTVLHPNDLPRRIEHLSPGDLCGIGPGMLDRFDAHGIRSVRDLWSIDRRRAREVWGSVAGSDWWAGFHGIDEPEIRTRRSSMCHANVLDPAFRSDAGAYGILVRLLCRIGARLRDEGYLAQSLHTHVRSTQEIRWRDEISLPCVQDTPTLLEAFHRLWSRRQLVGSPMKVGIAVGGLVPQSQVSDSLFSQIERPRRLSQAMDKINQRWGLFAVYFGPLHDFRHPMDDKIAFGRIPPKALG